MPDSPVKAGGHLELGAQLRCQGQALLLARKLEQVGALAHDCSTPGGHLENLLLGRLPGDHIELLDLRSQRPRKSS